MKIELLKAVCLFAVLVVSVSMMLRPHASDSSREPAALLDSADPKAATVAAARAVYSAIGTDAFFDAIEKYNQCARRLRKPVYLGGSESQSYRIANLLGAMLSDANKWGFEMRSRELIESLITDLEQAQ